MEELFGYLERITFQSEETGYTVAKIKCPGHKELVAIVGAMPDVQVGETLVLKGEWKRHIVFGSQFDVKECRSQAPADLEGIRKYLGSGLIKGIGPAYADRICAVFGVKTLEIIDQDPTKLLNIPGIGKKRIEIIMTCWSEQRAIRDVMIFLRKHGVSPIFAQKIYKMYGDKSVELIEENPYRLAKDLWGVGFKSADKIAASLGIEKKAPQRIEAGILHVLYELSSEGHTCYPLSLFEGAAKEILDVDTLLIQESAKAMQKMDDVFLEKRLFEGKLCDFIWPKSLYLGEIGIAKFMKRLLISPSSLREVDTKKALEWVQNELKIDLAPAQEKAVAEALQRKILIITGGPGTGKSTITNAILRIHKKLTSQIALAAPTGRAAKRMSEITGFNAKTIHALLEFDPRTGGFKRGVNSPLECELLIVDESSMIDTLLMYNLLKALKPTTRVIFVGDINQLPSVGPGNVLQEMIGSKMIPVAELTEIFRQASGSQIITNAHRINKGNMPDLAPYPDSDFFFIQADEKEKVISEILSLIVHRLPKKYGFCPFQDIQLLCPMKKGELGIENFNTLLQEKLNKENLKDPLFRRGHRFCKGDKVMQIRNNYQKEVFNGDVGTISSIDMSDQEMAVIFDDREVIYEFSQIDEIVLAYAVSVHKYQGSECPCIVMPVHTAHFKMLQKNLLYTGVTRGKKLVVIVGSKKAVALAVKNDEVQKRFTSLYEALSE